MTQYAMQVYKGVPFRYVLTKKGYYNIQGTDKITTDKDITATFSNYDAWSPDFYQVSESIPYVDIVKKIPGYYNFTKVGSPVVDQTTGIVSGLSTSNYLKLLSVIPDSITSVEMVFKFTITSTPSATGGICELSNLSWYGWNIAITSESKLRLWDDSENSTGNTVLSLNTDYWVKCVSNSSGSSLYLSTDGDNYNLEISITNNQFSSWINSSVYLGVRGYNNTEAFTYGEIDLSQSYIKINGETWWTPIGALPTNTGYLPDYSTVVAAPMCFGTVGNNYLVLQNGYSNFNIEGHPTLNQTTGEYTGSTLVTKETLNFSTAWECIIKLKTGSSVSSEAAVMSNKVDQAGFRFGYKSSKFMLLLGNGRWFSTSTSVYLGSHTISANTVYTVKFGWTGSLYYLYFLDSSNNWVSDISYSKSTAISNFAPIISTPATVYLPDVSMKINGVEKFDFTGKYSIEMPGLLYTSETDNGSAQTWDLYYKDGFTLSTTIPSQSEYVWCGSVSVPQHTVYPAYRKGAWNMIGKLYWDSYKLMGFSTSSFINLSQAFNPQNNPWEVKVKFTTSSDVTTTQTIFRSCISAPSLEGRYGILVNINSAKFGFSTSSDGTTWLFGESGTYTVLANTTYYVKFGWTGTTYYLDYSLDGETYTRDITHDSTSACYNGFGITQIGVYSYSTSYDQYFKGSIDLSGCYITINNSVWWTGFITE